MSVSLSTRLPWLHPVYTPCALLSCLEMRHESPDLADSTGKVRVEVPDVSTRDEFVVIEGEVVSSKCSEHVRELDTGAFLVRLLP